MAGVVECVQVYYALPTCMHSIYIISLNNNIMYVHVTTELTVMSTWSLVVSMQASPHSGAPKFVPGPALSFNAGPQKNKLC